MAAEWEEAGTTLPSTVEEPKMFGKWNAGEVQCSDISLQVRSHIFASPFLDLYF